MTNYYCLECKSWAEPKYHVDVRESWHGAEEGRWYCTECHAVDAWTDEHTPCEECEEIATHDGYCEDHKHLLEA